MDFQSFYSKKVLDHIRHPRNRGEIKNPDGAAIATSSIITTMVKGKPLEEAEKISEKAIAEALGGLPPVKFHCSVLAATALKKAIENYRKKKVK